MRRMNLDKIKKNESLESIYNRWIKNNSNNAKEFMLFLKENYIIRQVRITELSSDELAILSSSETED